MVIVDQMDMMLMQNWTYLINVFDHLNLKPTTVRPGMDFSRTNEWALNDLTSYRFGKVIPYFIILQFIFSIYAYIILTIGDKQYFFQHMLHLT